MKSSITRFLIVSLFLFCSCKGDDEAAAPADASGGSTTKSLFSEWNVTSDNFSVFTNGDAVDLSGGSFNSLLTLTGVEVKVKSSWRTALINAGRTNVPTTGTKYTCSYYLTIVGSETSGSFAMNTADNTDSFANNACLVLDNNCGSGSVCNVASDHTYTKTRDGDWVSLDIDWFGTGDSSSLGTNFYEHDPQ
jgi:hypothetical protein